MSILQSDTHYKIHLIKLNYVWTQIKLQYSLVSTSDKTKACLRQKVQKWGEIAKGYFKKITETVHCELPRKPAHSELSIAIHSISRAGYVTAALTFVHGVHQAWEASSFCDFLKTYLLQLHCIFLLLDSM